MFSYGIQVYCASMVYSDESANSDHLKILYHQSFVYIVNFFCYSFATHSFVTIKYCRLYRGCQNISLLFTVLVFVEFYAKSICDSFLI